MTSIGELFAKLTLDDSQFQAGMAAANASMQAATSSAAGLSSALNAVGTAAAVAGAAMAAGFGAAVVSGVETAASMQQIQLGFEALLGSASAATDEIAKLNTMAAQTPFEFADLVKGEQQLLAAGKALNLTAEGSRALLAAVGDRVSLMSGTAEQVKSVDIALSQMMMKGKVSAEEMNQMAEAGFDSWQRLSAELGVSTAKTQDMVTKGLVPAAKMMQAVVNQPGAALGAMQTQSQTLIGLFSTLKDVVAQGLGKAAQPLVESLTAAMPVITDFAGTLIAAMDPLIRGLGTVAGYAVTLLSAFNALNPAVQQFGIYAVIVGTAAVAGIAAIGIALLSLVPAIASVASAFLALDVSVSPFLLLAAGIGVYAAIAFGPWMAWMAIIGTAALSLVATAAGLYAAWTADFAGLGSVVNGLAAILYDLANNALGAVYARVVAVEAGIAIVVSTFGSLVDYVSTSATSIYSSLSHAFSTDGILGALTTVKNAMINTAISILASLNQLISGALPMLTKMGAGVSATATQGAILGAQVQLGSMAGAVALPPEVEESVTAATAATTDYRGALDGLLVGLDGASKKGHGASEAAKEHARAMKEEQKAAKEAADSLRDYVKLYEDAADAVYAKKANPAADFQKGFESQISAFMPKSELSVSDKLDLAQADLATALSRGTITQELYNADLAEIMIARHKIETDYADAQKAAQKKATQAVADQAVGIVEGMGKFGTLVSAAKEGAKEGGAAGAIVAVFGQLLAWNKRFQKAVEGLDKIIQTVTHALDGLVRGLEPVIAVVGRIITIVVGSLAPVFTVIGNVLVMLAPILDLVATMLSIVGVAFQSFGAIMTIISPILYAAFAIIDTVLRGVAIVILGVMLGIQTAWNAIIEVVADLMSALGAKKAAKALRAQEADTGATEKQIQTLLSTSYEDAIASATGATTGFHASVSGAAEAADQLTQSLSNVPTGFKLEKYIYDAAQGQGGGGTSAGPSYSGGASGSSSGAVVINIGSVTTSAQDGAALAKELQRYAKKKSVMKRYSPVTELPFWVTS